VQLFLSEPSFKSSECFVKELWLSQLANLLDVFSHVNELIVSLKGRNITLFIVHDKMSSIIIMKLQFGIKDLDRGNVQSLPTLEGHELVVKHDVLVDMQNIFPVD
jgi:hypothetical protein